MKHPIETGWHFATWNPRDGKPERHMVYYNSKYPTCVFAILVNNHNTPVVDLRHIKHDNYTDFKFIDGSTNVKFKTTGADNQTSVQ